MSGQRGASGEAPAAAARAPAAGGDRLAALRALLRAADLPPWLAARIDRACGAAALATARDAPYRLVRDVPGFPFAAADRLAALRGRALDQPERIAAALWALLDEAATHEGHVFLPRAELVGRAMALLGLPRPAIAGPLASLAARGDLYIEGAAPDTRAAERSDDAVYLQPLYRAEAALARRVRALRTAATSRLSAFAAVPWERAFAWLATRHRLALHADEQAAVRSMLTASLSVVSAPRGGRWPAVVRAALALCRAKQLTAKVVAATALAARHASTLLGTPVGTLTGDNAAWLEADLLIAVHADQLALDQALAVAVALPEGGHLALVGDPRTLPPLGPGWPFADMASHAVTTALAARPGVAASQLVGAAERMARGEPVSHLVESDDLWLCPADDPEQAIETVVQLIAERLPAERRFPPEVVAALCLARRGPTGAAALGAALRARLGGPRGLPRAIKVAARSFRPGERAILAEHLPHLGLPRGTLVRVAGPARPPGVVRLVLPDQRQVTLDEADAPALDQAAALEVQLAQGGPFRVVVALVLADDYVALSRRALYSAVSSARELCALVGQARALAHALASAREPLRYRRLAARLGTPQER